MTHKTVSLLVPVYKPVGKTPLECVEEYKSKHRLDPTTTVSYAGRLDPMAEGVLLLLVGDANKKRREYEHLHKEYEVTVLVGFVTDTGDLMGKLINEQFSIFNFQKIGLRREQLKEAINLFIGAIEQKYPIYSSAKVRGKPLYWWARQGRLDEIEIPSHKVQIDSIELITEDSITNDLLLKYIIDSVGSVKGDFRQDEIIKEWEGILNTASRAWIRQAHHDTTPKDSINMFSLKVKCGSGTYMRQLVSDIGEKLNIPLCAYKIKRSKVGKYRLEDCVK